MRYDRVAGYFTSTSLAVASQGFTALIKHRGHVRLVVGADLDPEDVRAIVDQDDRKRLADALIAELGSLDRLARCGRRRPGTVELDGPGGLPGAARRAARAPRDRRAPALLRPASTAMPTRSGPSSATPRATGWSRPAR